MSASRLSFDDLELRFDPEQDGTYRVVVTSSDGPAATGTFSIPFTSEELHAFVQRVGLVRSRSTVVDRDAEMRAFGARLFDAVMTDRVGSLYQAAQSRADAKDDRGMRLTLRLSGAPELMRLPWELMYRHPRFIAQSERTPLVRTLDLPSAHKPPPLTGPLRILGIISHPAGYAELDSERERRNLEQAIEPLTSRGRAELTWLDRATIADLEQRIAEPDDIHVLHYIGHGAYDEATDAGILVLETAQGRADDVSGQRLGTMLQDERSLRLVVLNSCEGARTSVVDPFSGVATRLLEFDIPAVVGMQFEITDAAAIAFSRSLYTGIANGASIDAAIGPARRAIDAAASSSEIGTPVLFLRSKETRLFDGAAPVADPPAPTPPEPAPPQDFSPGGGSGSAGGSGSGTPPRPVPPPAPSPPVLPPSPTGGGRTTPPTPGPVRALWAVVAVLAVGVVVFFGSLVVQNVFGVDLPWIPGTPGNSRVTPTDDTPPDEVPTEGTVPDVTGSAVDFAFNTLREAGFVNIAAEYVESDQTGNTVVSTNPPAGTTLGFDQVITVQVSNGFG
ncbi:hypothetical protein J2Y46_000198 [Microbacterium sp. BE35]|uniref:CHAT domain-containing protein n=1 Tax=Microbacterium sp. BE35 TaxID=2817773 RepID=UPI002863B63F|nr:CHAT domain-containing protein [Microbacterium sp. BE35]MDR7187382.1 hypothetical protein [Microbacterium sp. BE35]